MYEIKNISGCLSILGLYPGKSKIISNIDDCVREMFEQQLITITKITITKIDKHNIKNKNQNNKSEECEVTDTNGRNQNN